MLISAWRGEADFNSLAITLDQIQLHSIRRPLASPFFCLVASQVAVEEHEHAFHPVAGREGGVERPLAMGIRMPESPSMDDLDRSHL